MTTTIYRGASAYNGEEVAVQAQSTRRAANNEKTGDMVQLAIWATGGIPADKDAQRAACGGCALLESGVCYVVKMRLRASWERISDVLLSLEDFRTIRRVKRRAIRIGSDGDPGAVPASWWGRFFATVRPRNGWTGYTHGWVPRTMSTGEVAPACDASMARWFMASCDTVEEREAAKALGYRTARVSQDGEPLQAGEILCPAISTNGRIQCADCLLCDGTADGRASASPYFRKGAPEARPDIVFPAHGGAAQDRKFADLVAAMSLADRVAAMDN